MTEKPQTPNADSLMQAAGDSARKGPPPVHLWNPDFCGDLDMEIRRDGTWFYLGTPIGRPAMVKLFSSILKLEDGKYFLVTPVEKVGIRVEDAPFMAVDFRLQNPGPDQSLTFTTHVDDEVTAGPEHPIRVTRDTDSGEPAPYVMIRRGLEARIDRKSFYRLVDLGEHAGHAGQSWFGIRSGGQFFPIIPSSELES
ncbi:DUF1285 domain-containing protein [Falsigemmobacter faecalis]|uniref:DUF1285 domain-containing protein n=1 Tax=Falsigemmobacter faecalis TaxID=2488730 RepID=A0A3P3DRF5_9RHOB|nr:DUF1285 domain-containing protein [Falsigemmobacter faecalis]RRH76837.1 DUF1285 domain-containing protein [Falsigemmobacter faecalis]